MKRIYKYLMAVALVPALLFAAPGLSRADHDVQPPLKKGFLTHHSQNQIGRNGPKPAHRSVGYIKKNKNDSFSRLNH